MKKIAKISLITFFLGSLAYLFLANLFFEKKDKLYFENRKIEEKLSPSKENILDASYFKNLEERASDSFYKREELLKLSTKINLYVLKRPIINDLYLKEDLILSVWKDWNKKYPEEKIHLMTENYRELSDELEKRQIAFIYVGIPEHSSIYSDEYADYLHNKGDEWLRIEEDFFKRLKSLGVNNLKMREYLEEDIEKYYNKTDHHFSYYGAIETYSRILDLIGQVSDYNLSSEGIEVEKLEKDFKGSYSKKLFYQDRYDDESLIYRDDLTYTRKDNGSEVEARVFHNLDFEYGSYEMYMGGDVAFTEIDTERPELPSILIYGDSFTNPIETLIIRNSNKMWSVDFRHYREKGLLDLVDELNPDFVICIRDNLMYVDRNGNGRTN